MKLIKLRQFAVYLSITALSISCTGELSIEVQDWITLPDEDIELDIKNRVETVTVSSKAAWTAAYDVDWLVIEPSRGYAGETEVTITSTFEEDNETSGAIVFNSSQAGNFKETRLPVKHETLVADWITLPGRAVELDMKNNSKTVVVSSKANWTAVSDADWLVFEPSSGKAGETEVKITSTLNEDKENSGTIMFSSSDAGNLKDIPLTVKTVLSTTLQDVDLLLSIKSPKSSVTLTTAYGWKIESCPEWLTATPSQGSRTTNIKLSLKSSRYDCHEEGEIIIVDDNSDRVSVKVSHIKYFDEAFARVLQDKGYIPDASKIDLDIVKEIEVLTINSSELTNLKGIEFFKSLKTLDCSSNQLTSLDISNNTSLTYLDCSSNQLTSLDISNNASLTTLRCYSNQLTSLDISNNTSLTTLGCSYNQLTSLDISNNTSLTYLDCSSNQLTSLDISNNASLTTLACSSNQLTSLDISNNASLTTLVCYSNQLTSLDISNNTSLTTLRCYSNQLPSLDISNNTSLIRLWCFNNPGNGSKFPIKAWFDNNSIPNTLHINSDFGESYISWTYNSRTITVDFYK